MSAAALTCPMCGAAAEPESTQCGFCRARLATIACPSCFGLVFIGSKHCSHCGSRVQAPAPRPDRERQCPRRCGTLTAVSLGGLDLDECPTCHGTWVEVIAFEQLCADAERQASVLAETSPASAPGLAEKVRYGPCPECTKIMNRVNFAKSSGIVLDICKAHGVWLDVEELRRIVEFLRGGGLARAREREKQALGEELRLLRLKQTLARQESKHHAHAERDQVSADSMLVSIFSLFAN
jgi:Zn-finger nucleic acid-binding protein